jgi:hypothetical protein
MYCHFYGALLDDNDINVPYYLFIHMDLVNIMLFNFVSLGI